MYLLTPFPEKKKKPVGKFCLTAVTAALVVALPCLSASAGSIGTVTVDGNPQTVDVSATTTIGENANSVAIAGDNVKSILMDGKSSSITVLGNEITLMSTGMNEAVRAQNKGTINLGNNSTQRIDVTAGDYGIWVQNNTEMATAPEGASSLTIHAKDTVINAHKNGIEALSNGQLTINGNLTVNAPRVIEARGHSTVNINRDGKGKVVLNGDIAFATPGSAQNSGNVIDANVNINLTTADSSWTGNVLREYPVANENNSQYTDVDSGINLALSNQAQWNPTIITESSDTTGVVKKQALNKLALNDGIINIRDNTQTVKVGTLSGQGGTVNIAAQADSTAETGIKTGQLAVGEVASDNTPVLATRFTGITADDLKDAAAWEPQPPQQSPSETTQVKTPKPSPRPQQSEKASSKAK